MENILFTLNIYAVIAIALTFITLCLGVCVIFLRGLNRDLDKVKKIYSEKEEDLIHKHNNAIKILNWELDSLKKDKADLGTFLFSKMLDLGDIKSIISLTRDIMSQNRTMYATVISHSKLEDMFYILDGAIYTNVQSTMSVDEQKGKIYTTTLRCFIEEDKNARKY